LSGSLVQNTVSEETFQLPTQDSSSSEEDDDNDSAEFNERPSDSVCAILENSLLPQTPTGKVPTAVNATATIQNNQESLKEQSPSDQHLVDTPESRHVEFKTNTFSKISAAADLTDTPIKAFTNNSNKLGAKSRMSLESLTDTPLQCRKNVRQQRKSLDSLTDTPVQRHRNFVQKRKRLKTVPKKDTSKNPEPGTTEKLQRKDMVKKRVEEKYRCRFLDAEAAGDDSEESDEEDAIKQIEDEEMSHDSFINDSSQLGFTQDDLDRVNADAEIEVCYHAESVHHRQFNHQHNIDNEFKTPVFNRRMRAPASQSQHSEPSQKGLGNMNFIRSVLEHHRAGGDADQLEQEYHRLAGNNESQEADNEPDFDSPIQSKQPLAHHYGVGSQISNTNVAGPTSTTLGSSIQDGLGSQQKISFARGVPTVSTTAPRTQPVVLTAEQRAMIEAKRAEALKRRQQKMQQQSAPFNPYAK